MRKLIFKRDNESAQAIPDIQVPGIGARVVYLFHHCVAVEDERNEFGGWTDSPLTELGHTQAELMKDFIANNGLLVNTLWSSDLPRAEETAKQLLTATKSGGVIYTDRARSWGIGTEISGHVKTDQLYRDAKKFYVNNPDVPPPGQDAESLNQSRSRWMRFLMYVFGLTNPGSPNGIVCHGNNIKNTCQILGFGTIKIGHGAISRLIMAADGALTFEVLFVPPGANIGSEDEDDIRNRIRKVVQSGQIFRMSQDCIETRALDAAEVRYINEERDMNINPFAVIGEPGTGYESPDGKGEFNCWNCKYFGENAGKQDKGCEQVDMMARSKRERLPDGRVVVEDRGCCEYVHRIGRQA